MKNKNAVLNTAGAEMPDPFHAPLIKRQELEEAFSALQVQKRERLPESSGDSADRAQEEIDDTVSNGVDRIRREVAKKANDLAQSL